MYCEFDAVRLRHFVPIAGDAVVMRALLYNVASKVDPNVPSFCTVVPEIYVSKENLIIGFGVVIIINKRKKRLSSRL